MTVLHRVVGPPGCGKTTFVTGQAERAAQKYGRAGVVIASLTKAAAQEAAGRVTLDRTQVGTLHAHAYRSLGFPEIAEQSKHLKEWNAHAPEHWRSQARDPDDGTPLERKGDRDDYADYMRLRTSDVPRERWPDSIVEFGQHWEAWKRELDACDFCDLIERAAVETEHAPGDPAVILLDEAQDLSALEMRLANRWQSAAEQVVIVGDPDQCLYEWRGSDPSVFYQGEAATERTLEQSYRVPAAVHQHAVAWIEETAGRRSISYLPTSEPGDVRRCHSSFQRPHLLVDEATADPDGTSMILASCGYMLARTIAELRRRGVPFHNPYRPTQGAWNPLRGGASRVLGLSAPSPVELGGLGRSWTIGELKSWLEPLESSGFLQRGVKAEVEETLGTGRDRYGREDAEREAPFTLLQRLFVSEDDLAAALMGDLDWYESHLLGSWAKRLEYPLQIARTRGVAALRETPRLVVGTIHSVKGGEADDVWVIPDLSASAYWNDWHGDEASVRRLFYVAFTRARRSLHLVNSQDAQRVPWAVRSCECPVCT